MLVLRSLPPLLASVEVSAAALATTVATRARLGRQVQEQALEPLMSEPACSGSKGSRASSILYAIPRWSVKQKETDSRAFVLAVSGMLLNNNFTE